MNIGLIKIGERISFNVKSDAGLASGEPLVVVRMLSESGHNVKIGTVIKQKDILEHKDYDMTKVSFVDLEDNYESMLDCDSLICWGGYIDFWGGSESEYIMNQYKIINKFKGKIVFVLTDPVVKPEQLWPKIHRRPWGHKYKEEDILIKRKDITILSQLSNLDFVKQELKDFPYSELVYAPLWLLPGLFNKTKRPNPDPEFDLVYGGLNNRKKRYPKIKKWFFNGIKTGIFGRDLLSDKDFLKTLNEHDTEYLAKLKFGQQVINFANFAGKATVVIGDPSYETGGLIPNRFVESVVANVVAFIDIDLDPNKQLIKNPELNEFLYVTDKAELVEKLAQLDNFEFRKHILDLQQKEISTSKTKLVELFEQYLK